MVLDDGSQPLPLYVGRQAFPWNRDALASWDSGPLHPENGAWHSVSACFHGNDILLPAVLMCDFVGRCPGAYARVSCPPSLHVNCTQAIQQGYGAPW